MQPGTKRVAFWLVPGVLIVAGGTVAWSQADRLYQFRGGHAVSDTSPVPALPARVGALGRIEPESEVLEIGVPLGDRVVARACEGRSKSHRGG